MMTIGDWHVHPVSISEISKAAGKLVACFGPNLLEMSGINTSFRSQSDSIRPGTEDYQEHHSSELGSNLSSMYIEY